MRLCSLRIDDMQYIFGASMYSSGNSGRSILYLAFRVTSKVHIFVPQFWSFLNSVPETIFFCVVILNIFFTNLFARSSIVNAIFFVECRIADVGLKNGRSLKKAKKTHCFCTLCRGCQCLRGLSTQW